MLRSLLDSIRSSWCFQGLHVGCARRFNATDICHGYTAVRTPVLSNFAACLSFTPTACLKLSGAANIKAIYTYDEDAALITERLSATFLQQLQQQLATSSSNPQLLQLDIQPFVRVARDVLSYLRYSNSQALLPLLRQYSSSGTLDVSEIDPDVLQGEVLQMLNVTRLGEWYRAAAQYDVAGSRTVPPPTMAAAAAGSQENGQVRKHHTCVTCYSACYKMIQRIWPGAAAAWEAECSALCAFTRVHSFHAG